MKNIVYRSKILSKWACLVSRLMSKDYPAEIERRSHLDILDYKGLARPLPKYFQEICTDNNCFGIGQSIRRYAGYKGSFINGWIEHGYFYLDNVSSLASISFSKNIITFGSHRESVIKSNLPQKTCIKIGPYIHYAQDYVNEKDFWRLKNRLGRVLLVFPVHSGTGQQVEFNIEELFKNVESVAGKFDTVLFSLFWSDIKSDFVSKIESRGYRIVCSGHRFDSFFLSRQKTIIKLADVTMSNGLGTNLVYCTYLKKPHWLIHQEKTYSSLNSIGDKHRVFQEKNRLNTSITVSLYDSFKEYHETLTKEQYQLCSDFFGFNEVKSPKEMLELLQSL